MKQDTDYLLLFKGEWQVSTSQQKKDIYAIENNNYLGSIQQCTQEEIDASLTDLTHAQRKWKNVPTHDRAEYLLKCAERLEERKEEIASILSQEIAKPLKSARSEVERTVEIITATAHEGVRMQKEVLDSQDYFGGKQGRLALHMPEPLGVVVAISPFNYPVNLLATKIAPALMSGNTVLCKPAHSGILSALMLCNVFYEVAIERGHMRGIISCMTGRSSVIGDYLVSHPLTKMISFTGSTEVGKHIASLAKMIPLQLELGGKDPAVVLTDADLDSAASEIVKGAFSYNGQRCTAIKRVIAMEDVADALVEKIVHKTSELSVGNASTNADITPMISTSAADYVEELYNDAKELGATVGLELSRSNNMLAPSVLDNVHSQMRVYSEEQFGPLLPIIRVKTEDEAITAANDSEYGLQASVFTKEYSSFMRIAQRIDAGAIQMNNKTQRGPDNFPFTGMKQSGIGTQGIRYSLRSMTRDKVIVLRHE
jgi:glyceraldehyde-3-phosphate dehydrogenase (NADP+)